MLEYKLFSVVFEWLFSRLARGLFENKEQQTNPAFYLKMLKTT